MGIHVLKWLSMACSVAYVILAFSVLAVSISWHGDGVNTGVVRGLDYGHFLEALIGLGTVLAVVGFVGCIGSLNDSYWMTLASTVVVLVMAVGFGTISGVLSTQFARAEGGLRMDMTREIATYSDQNNETQLYWDDIQMTYNCCGIDTADDWLKMSRLQRIPPSCLPDHSGKVSFLPGCYTEALRPAQKAVEAGVSTTAIMAGLLAVGFVCNVVFCAILKRTRNKEL